MQSTSKFALRLLAPTAALALLSFACLGSLLYINDGNAQNRQKNYWQQLAIDEASYSDVKEAVASKNLPEALRPRARLLADLYRRKNKQAEAAAIYRLLWVASDNTFSVADGRELAAIYTDMGGFASAVESYQKIIAYDRRATNRAMIATDLNNLGQCYYMAGCASADETQRKKYLLASLEQFDAATKIIDGINEENLASDRKIIQQNSALSRTELDGSHSPGQNMK